MNWFNELFTGDNYIQAVMILSVICAAGLALGKIRIKGISLGVTFVFFAGILAGHFNIQVNQLFIMCEWMYLNILNLHQSNKSTKFQLEN